MATITKVEMQKKLASLPEKNRQDKDLMMIQNCKDWTFDETIMFLGLWGREWVRCLLTNSRRGKKTYEKISDKLMVFGYDRCPLQVRSKIFGMIEEYRRILRELSTEKRRDAWIYFEAIDKIYQAKSYHEVDEAVKMFHNGSRVVERMNETTLLDDYSSSSYGESFSGSNLSSPDVTLTNDTTFVNGAANCDLSQCNKFIKVGGNYCEPHNGTEDFTPETNGQHFGNSQPRSNGPTKSGASLKRPNDDDPNISNLPINHNKRSRMSKIPNIITTKNSRSILARSLNDGKQKMVVSHNQNLNENYDTPVEGTIGFPADALNATFTKPKVDDPAPKNYATSSTLPRRIPTASSSHRTCDEHDSDADSDINPQIDIYGNTQVEGAALLINRLFTHLQNESENMREWLSLEKERLSHEIALREQEAEREARREEMHEKLLTMIENVNKLCTRILEDSQ